MGLKERLRDETGMTIRLAADPLHAVVLGAGRALEEIDRFGTMIFGTGSDCLNIIDHHTGERRKPVLQDIADAMTVADALPHIDFVMCMFLPTDVPQPVADRPQQVQVNFVTEKPFFDAEIYLDGARQDRPDGTPYTTPCTIKNLPATVHHVVFRRKGLPKLDAGRNYFARTRQVVGRWDSED